jgi:hypothetical protein
VHVARMANIINVFKININVSHKERGHECLDWKYLAQDGVQCQAVVGTVMNLRFHKRRGIS